MLEYFSVQKRGRESNNQDSRPLSLIDSRPLRSKTDALRSLNLESFSLESSSLFIIFDSCVNLDFYYCLLLGFMEE